MRAKLTVLCFMVLSLFGYSAPAQSPNGTVSGIVLDPSGGAIVGAEVLIINNATGVAYPGRANSEGYYLVPNVPPATYRIQVSNSGFKTIIKPDIVVHVGDALSINFTLPIGAASEIVTVEGGAPLINTENAAVSTVINRQFVENLPLNGRSFNTLLQLTPGVVIAPSSSSSQGQFSVAGQRTSATNFLVDGVSANFGVAPLLSLGTSGTGAAQAFSALGGTSSLVSVEALQEFRVETSSFAPEFGRSPGGQVMLTTRAGTNDFHGGIYEYFRNDVLDANDWFANQVGQPRAAERHNDFGGFLGGRIQTDRTFFFLSYEGARLREPNTMVVEVPSAYARSIAPSAIAPFLDAYPQPTDSTVVPGVYTAPFTGNYSNPSTLDAGSIRLDHVFSERFSIFGRYNEAPSETAVRTNALSEVDTTEVRTRTLTIGTTMAIRPQLSNNLRGNFSLQNASLVSDLDSFAGAMPPGASVLAPNLSNPYVGFSTFDTSYYALGTDANNRSRQVNFADDLTLIKGSHQFKFGADYRVIFLDERPFASFLDYLVTSVQPFLTTQQAELIPVTSRNSHYRTQSTSLYAQDTWKPRSRLSLTYGLRWELNPAPAATDGTTLAAWRNVTNPADITLAPSGTPPWNTTYGNFAPRIGVACSLTPNGDLVLRAGWGIYYDLGVDAAAGLGSAFPNYESGAAATVTLPLADARPYLPVLSTTPPYSGYVQGFSPDLSLPRSYQWNVALEKSFFGEQALSVTYLGQAGRNLLRQEGLSQPNENFAGAFLLTQNGARSNYNALQIQYRKPISGRLQALLNYTWSHSLDNASNDVVSALSSTVISAANDYASSDFDIRNSFSGAITYAVPGAKEKTALGYLTRDWSVEVLVVARDGFPFNASVLTATIGSAYPRPNLQAGQPIWIFGSQFPGGKSLNPNAFTVSPSGEQGSEGRNDIAGFGLTQVDLSVGRRFPLTERVSLQFRTDAFNVLNHPNFTNPYAYIGFGTAYLSSTMMLNHGLGGLNPLFQEGGPRSLQLSLKLTF